jgi:anionic cell wall polymer biosynthesis LytR-Cps2A-Psr (LCP) family protein
MNGKKALFFARERKSFEGKDSLRVENQQRVVKAVIDKMTSSTTLLTKYGDIVGAAGKSLETNMSNTDMQNLVKMQLSDLSPWSIESQKIEGEYAMDYVASLAKTSKYQVYVPDPESVAACLDAIETVMNPTQEELDEILENKKRTTAINFIRNILGRKDEAAEVEEQEGE